MTPQNSDEAPGGGGGLPWGQRSSSAEESGGVVGGGGCHCACPERTSTAFACVLWHGPGVWEAPTHTLAPQMGSAGGRRVCTRPRGTDRGDMTVTRIAWLWGVGGGGVISTAKGPTAGDTASDHAAPMALSVEGRGMCVCLQKLVSRSTAFMARAPDA